MPFEDEDDTITFEILSQVHRLEKSKGKLTEINGNFYEKTREYIDQLHSEIKAEGERNSSSPKLIMMKDELVRAERDFKRIYDLRQRKILLMANAQSTGVSASDENMLPREREILRSILELLEDARRGVCEGQAATVMAVPGVQPVSPALHQGGGGEEKAEPEPPAPERADEEEAEVGAAADKPEQDTEPEAAEPEGAIESYEDKEGRSPYPFTIVQMKADMNFSGPETEYKLKKEDLISLPEEIAAVLIKKKKAVVVL